MRVVTRAGWASGVACLGPDAESEAEAEGEIDRDGEGVVRVRRTPRERERQTETEIETGSMGGDRIGRSFRDDDGTSLRIQDRGRAGLCSPPPAPSCPLVPPRAPSKKRMYHRTCDRVMDRPGRDASGDEELGRPARPTVTPRWHGIFTRGRTWPCARCHDTHDHETGLGEHTVHTSRETIREKAFPTRRDGGESASSSGVRQHILVLGAMAIK